MPDIKIKITGLDEALAALNISEGDMRAAAGKAAALSTIATAKPYPPQSHKAQPFRSLKSQHYFFAALRSGAITVPYRRTFQLQDAWRWEPTPDGADVVNDHPHADGVIGGPGRPRAWPYHVGNWPTETQIAVKAAPEAGDAAEMAIIELLVRAGV